MNFEIITILLAFIVLINPFSALTLFLDLTRGYSDKNRRKFAQIACITIVVAITFFTLLGQHLLNFLGISLGAFQIAGGILVFLIGLNMMNGEGNPVKPDEEAMDSEYVNDHDITSASAVVPLAFPMMIGPGGISTVIIYSAQTTSYSQISMILVAGILISILCYISLMMANKLSNLLGDTGLNILNRIMGMLLTAVAVEIFFNGLHGIAPEFFR